MQRFYIGCCGFSFNDWRGVFYPSNLPKERWLEHYKKYFSVLELNFSFYKFPSASISEKILQKAPHLKYSVKVHQKFTHRRNYSSQDVEYFLKGIEPFTRKDNLITLLFQFPETFGFNEENLSYLEKLHKDFIDFPQAFEFRNKSWKNKEVFLWLEERNITLVNIDAPKNLSWLIGPWVSTGEFDYIRLHGRNEKKLYDYLYSHEELEEILRKIKKMSRNKKVYILFNNTIRAQCVANGIMLKQILGLWNENIPIPNPIKKMLARLYREYE